MQDSAAPETRDISLFRIGDLIMIDGIPWTIDKITKDSPEVEKDSHIHIIGTSAINGKPVEKFFDSFAHVNVPHISEKEYQIKDISGDLLTLVDSNEHTVQTTLSSHDTMKEINASIKKKFEEGTKCYVTVINADGTEIPCDVRGE